MENPNGKCGCTGDKVWKGHFGDKCFDPECVGPLVVGVKVCNCVYQCGCQLGVKCKKCNKNQQPIKGQGWCNAMLKLQRIIKPNTCSKFGCKKPRHSSFDYCGATHAKEDGAKK